MTARDLFPSAAKYADGPCGPHTSMRVAGDILIMLDEYDRLTLNSRVQVDVIDSLVALVRDLATDDTIRPYPGGPCVWCHSMADEDEAHDPDCPWLRARALIGKAT